MIRFASSTSSGWTEMRTSPSPSTDRGKIECRASPAGRARCWPRCRSACGKSPSKRTRGPSRSSNRELPGAFHHIVRWPRDEVVDLQQDHGHVIVLRGGADEDLDLAQDPLAQLLGRQMAMLFDDSAQPCLLETIGGLV